MLDPNALGLAPIILPDGQEIWIRKASFTSQATKATDLRPLAQKLLAGDAATFGPSESMPAAHAEEREPRRWAYQPGFNLRTQPRSTEPISFAVLKAIADNYDVARLCIAKRIDEMRDLHLTWRPKPVKGEDRKEYKSREERLEPALTAAADKFTKPNDEDFWAIWLAQWLEDLFRYDAPTIFLRPARDGSLYSCEVVDGSTIRPIVDLWGRVPKPPEPAYGQVLFGQTWGTYTTDELLYSPFWQRSDSPYGHPPAEWILLGVNRALRRQTIDLNAFTEGNLPPAFFRVPEGWTNAQIGELQDAYDQLTAGNDAARSKLRFVPGGNGAGLDQVHPEPKTEVEEWLMYLTCAAYGVNATELGFVPRGSGLGGAGFAEQQTDAVRRRSTKPMAAHICGIVTWIANERMGLGDIEAFFPELEDTRDALQQAQADDLYVRMGKVSVDELRERDDEDPIGLGQYIATGTGPVLVEDFLNPPEPDPALVAAAAAAVPGGPVKPPSDGKPDPSASADDLAKASDAGVVEDLDRWQRKSLKALRSGRRADVVFRSSAITPPVAAFLAEALAKASSTDDVKAAFATVKAGASAGPFALEHPDRPSSAGDSPATSASWAAAWSGTSAYRRSAFRPSTAGAGSGIS